MFRDLVNVRAYIDGFNLYYGMKIRNWRRFYWLDLHLLVLNLLKPNQILNEVKYFTTRVSSTPTDPEKSKRQNTYLEALETLPDMRFFFGRYIRKTVKCRRCNSEWKKPEEKMTDVNIASEMIVDAFQDAFDVALLVSGDGDLVPPVGKVCDLFPHKRVVMVFPPDRFLRDLALRSSTAPIHIGRNLLKRCQLPDQVVKPDGIVLQRPLSWQ